MPSAVAWFPWWACLLDVLVVARLTRLATRDSLPPVRDTRNRLIERTPGPWKQLWVCPWCLSPWLAFTVIGLHVVVGALFGPTGVLVWALLCAPLAVSYVVGFIADYEKQG